MASECDSLPLAFTYRSTRAARPGGIRTVFTGAFPSPIVLSFCEIAAPARVTVVAMGFKSTVCHASDTPAAHTIGSILP
jgi:hypothetical protein